eukprot:TRINITY_DN8679_c0_g1_i1.p1 TRINITY_DN8679_c0_g1~~TRINITY_DN8679_c0_g1_i1.p1  ORF type:complete len:196 (+),score=28.13 TRINITY_DN8679_c0_g1_i1:129-716(+)
MCTRIIILPGNGGGDVRKCNWYAWLQNKLQEELKDSVEVILRNMPDPVVARRSKWLPFVINELGADEKTIIIGHSSGAEAAMRLAEEVELLGIILVGACHTDLGEPNEAASGYYPDSKTGENPWRWELQKQHCKFISVFASENDPFLPIAEQQHVSQSLSAEYLFYPSSEDKGHWISETHADLLKKTLEKVKHYN